MSHFVLISQQANFILLLSVLLSILTKLAGKTCFPINPVARAEAA